MRKLLLFSLLTLGVITNSFAQVNCNFTYTADTTNGTYTFYAPAEISNSMLYSIVWYYGNGSGFATGPSFTTTYNAPTTDQITMTVYIANDSLVVCNTTQTIQVWGGSNTGGCTIVAQNNGISNTYAFNIPGANYPATWQFPDGTTYSGFQATYTFPGPGTYQVCANITGGGFTCNDCETIYIAEDSSSGTTNGCDASFYASTSALTGYFIPYGTNLNTNPTGGAVNYLWNFGDGATSNEVYPYHIYNQAGIYNVCLIVGNANANTCSDTVCQNVIIPENNTIPNDSSCQAYFVMTQQNPFEVTVVNASTAANAIYTWTISGNGITFSAQGAYPSMTIETTGSYGLCLTVTTGNCTSTYCDSLVIGTDGLMGGRLSDLGFTINVTSPQAITGFDVTGIETSAFDVSIYPNPSAGNFVIAGGVNGNYSISSMDGKQIAIGQIINENQLIDVRHLADGVYFLTVWNATGERSIQRIVKH